MTGHPIALLMLVFGLLMFVGVLAKSLLERAKLPSLVAFMVLGFVLRLGQDFLHVDIGGGEKILSFLSHIGVTCLLFRVGLESDLAALLSRLKVASVAWLGNVVLSGGGGYLLGRYLLQLDQLPSLFLAVALTATSVGVSVMVWNEQGALKTRNGQLLVDIAELDDISGVIFMAMLFAVGPDLASGNTHALPAVMGTLSIVLLKLVGFGACCLLFSRYLEKGLTDFCKRLEHGPDPMISMVMMVLVIAGTAGLLGCSVAIGAFFGGLVFSRDPAAVRMEASFDPIYEFFTPFFFIHIGFLIGPQSLGAAAGIGLLLLFFAVTTKLLGTALPALPAVGARSATVLGISMAPRAEIALIVMQRGTTMTAGVIPDRIYSAMALVSAVTCLASPLVLRRLFRRWPATVEERT